MILPFFAVYDSKALTYSVPYTQHNADVAIRAFANAANTPGNTINQHPEDFSLIEIGAFDDEKGVIASCDHINHGLAAQYVRKA